MFLFRSDSLWFWRRTLLVSLLALVTVSCIGRRTIAQQGDGESNCTDGIDNDHDELIDCDDSDCSEDSNCVTFGDDDSGAGDDDTGDDDTDSGDDDTDSGDDDTSSGDDDTSSGDDDTSPGDDDTSPTGEVDCDDGVDNDGDFAVDCADADCAGTVDCFESDCSDGLDNDGDLSADCDDNDCASDPDCALGDDDDSSPSGSGVCLISGIPLTCPDVSSPNSTVMDTTFSNPANLDHYACSSIAAPGPELVYEFSTPTARTVTVEFTAMIGGPPGTSSQLNLYVLEDGLNVAGCDPQNCILAGVLTSTSFHADAGQTYYFAVDTLSASGGAFYTLVVSCI